MKKITLLFSTLIIGLTSIAQTCFDVGTGSDGAYSATVNTTLAGGTYNYTSFNINSGVTVSVTGTQPLIIRCTGSVTINGLLVAKGGNGTDGVTYVSAGVGGIAVAGGGNGGAGAYSSSLGPLPGTNGVGVGGATTNGDGWSGGGGAGYANVGAASGGVGGFGGPVYGTTTISGLESGSGGGGGSGGYSCGSGGGGAGGGLIVINAGTSIVIGVTGGINVNGGNGGSDGTGNCGGGGGGSGGSLWIASPSMTNNGSLQAVGGTGGASNVPGTPYFGTGGTGSNGRIRVDHNGALLGTGTVTPAIGASFPVSTLTVSAVSQTNILCNGNANGAASVAVSGSFASYNYDWLPGTPTGDGTANVTGLTSGTWTCTVTDSNSCVASQVFTITEPTLLTASSSATSILCNGGTASVTVVASGGITPYIGDGVFAVGAGAQTYNITDANGCATSTSITITEPAALVSTGATTNTTTCGGIDGAINVSVAGGTSPYTYLWSNSVVTEDLTGLIAGTYTVAVTDANGCTSTLSATVADPVGPTVTLSIATDTVCQASAAFVLTGGSPVGGTYSGSGVSGGSFNPATASLGVNTITYSFTDVNGCSGSSTNQIFVDVCLGISSHSESGLVHVYPNPAFDVLTIETSNGEHKISLFDVLGNLVYSTETAAPQTQIDLKHFSNGVYFVKVESKESVNTVRVLKSN